MSIPLSTYFNTYFVIPAKAGTHHLRLKFRQPVMDPRLRGGDDIW